MVTLVFLCRRRPDLRHGDYAERLLGGHVPLALRHHPTMRKYVVNLVQALRAGAETLDSIGELSFDSLADFHERLYDSDDGPQLVRRDPSVPFRGESDLYMDDLAPDGSVSRSDSRTDRILGRWRITVEFEPEEER